MESPLQPQPHHAINPVVVSQIKSRLETKAQRVRQRLKSIHPILDWCTWFDVEMLSSTSLQTLAKQILSYKLEKFLILILTIGILSILPLVSFLFICMLAIRHGASLAAKNLRPDLGSIIPSRSAGFATDLIYNRIPKFSIVVPLYLDGHLDVGELRMRMCKVLEKKDVLTTKPNAQDAEDTDADADAGTLSVLRYPELKQFVYSWYGILFWKWERNFKIENHVNLLHNEEEHVHGRGHGHVHRRYVQNSEEMLDEDDLSRIGSDFITKPYRKGRSPWEILIQHHKCKITGAPRTLVIFRIHHALADGFSLLRFCMEELSNTEDTSSNSAGVQGQGEVSGPNEHFSPTRTLQVHLAPLKLFKTCVFTIQAAYDLATLTIKTWDFNSWKLPERKLRHRLNIKVTKPISLSDLKRIKNQHHVGLTSLVLTVFAGAIRNYMLETTSQQHQRRRLGEVPDHVHSMITLPFPGHSGRLTNHMTGTVIQLPLKLQSPLARLLAIQHDLESWQRSTIPILMFYMVQISGIVFAPITWLYFGDFAHTCALSNFPGPDHVVKFAGHDILDGTFFARIGNMPFTFLALSYNGNIRFVFELDEAILPKSVELNFSGKIMEELQSLDGDHMMGNQ